MGWFNDQSNDCSDISSTSASVALTAGMCVEANAVGTALVVLPGYGISTWAVKALRALDAATANATERVSAETGARRKLQAVNSLRLAVHKCPRKGTCLGGNLTAELGESGRGCREGHNGPVDPSAPVHCPLLCI